jgi:glycosyltransferase involved in cell wall biosynthesis
MRVLIVTDWPGLEAGTERTVERLRAGLAEAGDHVRLLTSSVGSAAGGTAEYVAYGSERLTQQSVLQLFNPSAYACAKRAVRDFSPDAVHLNMFLPHLSPSVLPALKDIPTTMAVYDYKPICPRSTKLLPDGSPCSHRAGRACVENGCLGTIRSVREGARYLSFKRGSRHLAQITTVSEWMRGELAMNGIDAEVVDLPVPRPEPGFARRPADEPLFVYAGRLAPVKGVDLLLEAFSEVRRRVPNARLVIRGDGPMRDGVRNLARTLRLGASLSTDFTMARNWHHLLTSAWAVVVPSVYREPLGLVAIESITHGVPVIAPAEGGFAEIVESGRSGVLIPARDRTALAGAMEHLALRRAFPTHSVHPEARRAILRRHDPDRYVSRTRSILQRACEDPRWV